MLKHLFCLFFLFVFSISVLPTVHIISLLHQEEMYDDLGEEDISIIKKSKEAVDHIYILHVYLLIFNPILTQHHRELEQFSSRLFNDIITPPPDL